MTGEWVSYDDPATVTVVTGGRTVDEVLVAFGADPSRATVAEELDDVLLRGGLVQVCAAEDVVFAVEPNGWQGSRPEVLRRLGERGRAASWYWNVNAVTRLSFARGGVALASFDPGHEPEPDGDDDLVEVLAQVDLDQDDRHGAALRAIELFTGRAFRLEDYQRVRRTRVGYRIVAHLDDLRAVPREPGAHPWLTEEGPLGPDSPALARLADEPLRHLAWWLAAQIVAHYRLADDPAIAAALADRAMSDEAQWLARRGHLTGGRRIPDDNIWGAIRAATNPDPLAAAFSNIGVARYVLRDASDPEGHAVLNRVRAAIRNLS